MSLEWTTLEWEDFFAADLLFRKYPYKSPYTNPDAKARTFEFMSTDRLNSKTEALPDGSGEIFKIGQLRVNHK